MPPFEPRLHVLVSRPVKQRLDAMRDGKMAALDRSVTLGEIIEDLLAEHDKAMEEVESA